VTGGCRLVRAGDWRLVRVVRACEATTSELASGRVAALRAGQGYSAQGRAGLDRTVTGDAG
jgi:hypothetical protein